MAKSKDIPGRSKAKAKAPSEKDLLPGTTFGTLVILQKVYTPPRSNGGQRYRVKCVCGTRETVPRFYLVRKVNPKTHCGCKAVKADEPYTKRSWHAMHLRCYYKSHVAYNHYGGRGIHVCERWHRDNPSGWENFKEDMGIRPKNMSLDRIDPNGIYEPNNCRWATAKTQRLNQRGMPPHTPDEE